MKKLRLIKPWTLRAVRLRLQDAHFAPATYTPADFTPCQGPRGDDAIQQDRFQSFAAPLMHINFPTAYNNAPVSAQGFISLRAKIIR
jgi:hypothetical protein